MSGFFGIFSPKGKSIDLDAFEQMRTASEREGFDGMHTLVEDNIAFGHLMLRVSPESQYDKQPLRSDCGNYLLVGHFRLDYRDELGDKLGLTQSELLKTPDSRLVMMAYLKWNENCVEHFEGDYAFALFSKRDLSLMVTKEKAGFSSLFYVRISDHLFFSSDLHVLSSLSKLEKNIDLQMLFQLSIPGTTPTTGLTLLKNVYSLTASITLYFNSDLVETKLLNENILVKKITPICYRNIDDYILAFKSTYSIAIKSRVSSCDKIGLLLSSGLDSSSVAFFTAKELELSGRVLSTYTSCPLHMDQIPKNKHSIVDESSLVKEYVKFFPNINAQYLDFPSANYMDLLESELTNDYLNPILTSNTFWISGIIDECINSGIKAVYSGQLGNFTVSWNAPYIFGDLIFKGKFLRSIKYLTHYSKIKRIPFLAAFKEKYLAVYYRQIILALRNLTWSIFIDIKLLSDLSVLFLSKHRKLVKSELGIMSSFSFFYNSAKTRRYLVKLYFENATISIHQSFSRKGLIFVDPTSDSRLLEFLFSIPDDLFNYNGEEKFIYKQLMKSEGVIHFIDTETRRLQSLDIPFRLKDNLELKKINLMLNSVSDIINEKSLAEALLDLFQGLGDYRQKRNLCTNLIRKLSLLYFISKNHSNFNK